MKTYRWQKEFINGKWYTVCTSHKHVPMIKWNSDSTYSVKGSDGKPRIEKEFKDAINFAIETYKKMSKFNIDHIYDSVEKWENEHPILFNFIGMLSLGLTFTGLIIVTFYELFLR